VTLNGAPLYRFFQDTSPGTTNGNGIMDSFNGVNFTWHVESGRISDDRPLLSRPRLLTLALSDRESNRVHRPAPDSAWSAR
jgi:Secreted repeat of unknown function